MIAVADEAPTVGAVLAGAAASFAAAGIAEPRADAEVLLAHALRVSRSELVLRVRTPLDLAVRSRFEALAAERIARRPVWHLLGRREFWSLDFRVDSRVLTPRPETELLVERVCSLAPRGGRVVDVGTGSGAIAVAVARERPDLRVVAVEVDAAALVVAAENVRELCAAVRLVRGSWLSACAPGLVDVVVANPPYVRADDLAGLPPEVRDHEPCRALDGGPDGLAGFRRVVDGAAVALASGGHVVLEVGEGQAGQVEALLRPPVWTAGGTARYQDLAGIARCVTAERGGA